MRLSRIPATALIPFVLLAGCSSNGDEPAEPAPSPVSDPTSSEAVVGPEPGSGAALDPDDAEAWCAAVTAEQLGALTGFEMDEVVAYDKGVTVNCRSGGSAAALVDWVGGPGKGTLEQYARRFAKPSGVFEVTESVLDDGTEVVVATTSSPVRATVGTVVRGRQIEVTVSAGAAGDEFTPQVAAAQAKRILATYVG